MTPDVPGPGLLEGVGTTEAAWQASGVLETIPVVEAHTCRPPGRVVVVAPHPDDEVLGVGATLAEWATAGTPIVIVGVTDGEASHPGSLTVTPPELAMRRADERVRALGLLGIDPAAVVRLGLPDGGVDAGTVAGALTAVLRPGDICLAPVERDGHPDHDATAVAATVAARHAGVPRWAYPVWLWHWADPGSGFFAGARRVVAADAARRAKLAAIDCFTTQITALSPHAGDAAILAPSTLARVTRDHELLWGPTGTGCR